MPKLLVRYPPATGLTRSLLEDLRTETRAAAAGVYLIHEAEPGEMGRAVWEGLGEGDHSRPALLARRVMLAGEAVVLSSPDAPDLLRGEIFVVEDLGNERLVTIEDPPLKLVLIEKPGADQHLNHLGVEAVTAEEVQQLAQELFQPDRLSLALIGP